MKVINDWINENNTMFKTEMKNIDNLIDSLKGLTKWWQFVKRRQLDEKKENLLRENYNNWKNHPMIVELNEIFDNCKHDWKPYESKYGWDKTRECRICGLKETSTVEVDTAF